jgi:Lipopolysaccharide kinase (Kdo/WaaP) family
VAIRAVVPLPYTPRAFRARDWRGVGHPELLALLGHIFPVACQEPPLSLRVYKRLPNLVQEVQLPVSLPAPWSRVVVKHFGWRGSQHFLCSPLKRSKAMKAYRIACHLLTHGLLTPLPLGACEARRWGFIRANVYITETLSEYIPLRKYCRSLPDGAAGMAEVVQLAATYTRRMHDSGLWHRDLSLNNLLVAGPPGQRRLYLIDLNRAQRLRYVPGWLRALDLARLDWRAWQPQFLALYCDSRFAAHRMQRIVHLYQRWRAGRRWILRGLNPLRTRLGLK